MNYCTSRTVRTVKGRITLELMNHIQSDSVPVYSGWQALRAAGLDHVSFIDYCAIVGASWYEVRVIDGVPYAEFEIEMSAAWTQPPPF